MEEPLKRGGRLGSCVLMISRVRHPKKLPINVNWAPASLKNHLPIIQLFNTILTKYNMRCHQIDTINVILPSLRNGAIIYAGFESIPISRALLICSHSNTSWVAWYLYLNWSELVKTANIDHKENLTHKVFVCCAIPYTGNTISSYSLALL